MANYTPNLNLRKPLTTEKYDVVADLNDTKDKIDTHAGTVNAQLTDTANKSKNVINPSEIRFIAHRGASGIAPENTIPSYELAGKLGFWGGEADVFFTSDGKPVLIHDETVDRTTDGSGLVSDFTLSQIRNLTVTFGANVASYPNLKIPTLEEFLLTCKKVGLVPIIEIKATNNLNNYDTLIDIIIEYVGVDNCIIMSFDEQCLFEVRKRNKRIKMQYINVVALGTIAIAESLGNTALNSVYTHLTRESVKQAHEKGIEVNTWTVNDYNIARKCVEYGVDYITSDFIIGGIT